MLTFPWMEMLKGVLSGWQDHEQSFKTFYCCLSVFSNFSITSSYFRISKGTDWHSLLLCWTGVTVNPKYYPLFHQACCMCPCCYRSTSKWRYDISQDHCRETTAPFRVSFNHFHCSGRKLHLGTILFSTPLEELLFSLDNLKSWAGREQHLSRSQWLCPLILFVLTTAFYWWDIFAIILEK